MAMTGEGSIQGGRMASTKKQRERGKKVFRRQAVDAAGVGTDDEFSRWWNTEDYGDRDAAKAAFMAGVRAAAAQPTTGAKCVLCGHNNAVGGFCTKWVAGVDGTVNCGCECVFKPSGEEAGRAEEPSSTFICNLHGMVCTAEHRAWTGAAAPPVPSVADGEPWCWYEHNGLGRCRRHYPLPVVARTERLRLILSDYVDEFWPEEKETLNAVFADARQRTTEDVAEGLIKELADLPLVVPGSKREVFQAIRRLQELAQRIVAAPTTEGETK